MAGDNTSIVTSQDPAAIKVADDEVSYNGDAAHVQIIQLAEVTGAEGAHALRKYTALDTLTGGLTESAPSNDTNSSGLNGRLQRIAQRLTSLIALLPAALTTNGGALKVGASEVVITHSVPVGAAVATAFTDLSGLRNWGFYVPSNFDGTQVQFQTSYDGTTGNATGVYDITNTRVLMTVAAGRYYDIPGELLAIRYVCIECLTNQAGTTTDFQIIGKS